MLDEVTIGGKNEKITNQIYVNDPILVWTTSMVREIEESKCQHYEFTITPFLLERL